MTSTMNYARELHSSFALEFLKAAFSHCENMSTGTKVFYVILSFGGLVIDIAFWMIELFNRFSKKLKP